jgi:conjugal transfer pilus assembly protein TraF
MNHEGEHQMIKKLAMMVIGLMSVIPTYAQDWFDRTTQSFWQDRSRGWFWYEQKPEPKEIEPEESKPVTSLSTTKSNKPNEVRALEALQERYETSKAVAIMNPSEKNMYQFLTLQKELRERSARFADVAQRVVWTSPELDYSLTGRPTNSVAIKTYDQQQQQSRDYGLKAVAQTHGLFFVFRSDCPYCHKMAPIIQRFAAQYGFTIIPISMDGRGITEFPQPMADNGLSQRLQAKVVPALYLVETRSRTIHPIGYGVMADNEVAERIQVLMNTPVGQRF